MVLGKRIAIIGSSGSGKSTLARTLGVRLGLPVVHLDAHFWRAGWVETDKAQWQETVQALAHGERWIIDGNYSSTMDIRLPLAETIIFLDFRAGSACCASRRWLTYQGRNGRIWLQAAQNGSTLTSCAGSGTTRSARGRRQ